MKSVYVPGEGEFGVDADGDAVWKQKKVGMTTDARKRHAETVRQESPFKKGDRVIYDRVDQIGTVILPGPNYSYVMFGTENWPVAWAVGNALLRKETSEEALALLRKKLLYSGRVETSWDAGVGTPVYDVVAQPEHYTHSKIEVWDAIAEWGLGYRLGNVVKYVARADRKGAPVQDLEKALAYLTKEIEARRAG